MHKDIVVDKNNLNNYKLKITTLSPVHIGTGEVYEPTNFVIDEKKLYKFDEVLFYKSLGQTDKKLFYDKLSNYMQIIDFYKSKKQEAKKIAELGITTSSKVQNQYNKQTNQDGSKNKNQFEIQTTFKNPNTHRAIIPGSSIKGMLETAMKIYVKPPKASNEIRQNIIISDALLLNGGLEIGYANRRHRHPDKKSKDGIYQIIEVIQPNSEFILTIDSKQSFEDIQKAMKEYHHKRYNSRYEETKSSFIAKIGKNVAMDYVVEVDDVSRLRNKDNKPLATHFLYSSDSLQDEQFGWIKMEIITDDEYRDGISKIEKQEIEYYDNIEQKQKSIKEQIKQEKEQSLKLAKEKEQKAKEETELKAKKEADEKARVESLSPLEKIIDEQIKKTPSVPKHTVIFNAVIQGIYDEFKCDALAIVKKEMQDSGKWKPETKAKKPENDKDYQKTLKVLEMIEKCK